MAVIGVRIFFEKLEPIDLADKTCSDIAGLKRDGVPGVLGCDLDRVERFVAVDKIVHALNIERF